MKKLKCSEDCGSEMFEVSLTVNSSKQLAEDPERVSTQHFDCVSCGAQAEEGEDDGR